MEKKVPAHFQRLPVSIKASKFGSPIGFGDALRQFSIEEDFLLIVGFWKQMGNTKRIVATEAAKVSVEQWQKLWSPITIRELRRLDAIIKNVNEGYQETRRKAREMKKQEPCRSAKIVLNPKIDSKSQRRLQCSLPFKTFWESLAKREPYQSDAPELFGEKAQTIMFSPPRSFKKKFL